MLVGRCLVVLAIHAEWHLLKNSCSYPQINTHTHTRAKLMRRRGTWLLLRFQTSARACSDKQTQQKTKAQNRSRPLHRAPDHTPGGCYERKSTPVPPPKQKKGGGCFKHNKMRPRRSCVLSTEMVCSKLALPRSGVADRGRYVY